MYSNVFDTVRTSPMELVRTESLLYTSLINGLHPTLSLSQAIDSKALAAIIMKDDSFLDLIREQHIRVALFQKYDGKDEAINSFLLYKLNSCIDEQVLSYKFSSMDFLYNGKYENKQLVEIYKIIRDIITGEKNGINTFDSKMIGFESNSDDTFLIENHLFAIKKLIEAVNRNYLLPPDNIQNKDSLYVKLLHALDLNKKNEMNAEEKDALKAFKTLLCKQIDQNIPLKTLNNRSYLYTLIESLKLSKDTETKIKSIIDLLYNEVVAASLADTEDSIIIYDNDTIFPDVIIEDSNRPDIIDKASQKLNLIDTATFMNFSNDDTNVISWDIVREFRNQFRPYENDPYLWNYKVSSFLKQERFKTFELKSKKLIVGTVFFTINALCQYTLASSDIHPGMQVCGQLISDSIINKIADKINAPIDAEIIEHSKYKTLKPYFKQTTFLVKNLNN